MLLPMRWHLSLFGSRCKRSVSLHIDNGDTYHVPVARVPRVSANFEQSHSASHFGNAHHSSPYKLLTGTLNRNRQHEKCNLKMLIEAVSRF